METWKPIVGYEGLYEVSDLGRVRGMLRGGIKRPTTNKRHNRPFILLWRNDKAKAVSIHRLVLLAFVGKPPRKHEACHNDGNPFNNRLSNLRWDTPAANQADRVKHGTSNRGERCASSKLTEQQVLEIRADPRQQKDIAAAYGIQQNTVSRIKNRIRWSWL